MEKPKTFDIREIFDNKTLHKFKKDLPDFPLSFVFPYGFLYKDCNRMICNNKMCTFAHDDRERWWGRLISILLGLLQWPTTYKKKYCNKGEDCNGCGFYHEDDNEFLNLAREIIAQREKEQLQLEELNEKKLKEEQKEQLEYELQQLQQQRKEQLQQQEQQKLKQWKEQQQQLQIDQLKTMLQKQQLQLQQLQLQLQQLQIDQLKSVQPKNTANSGISQLTPLTPPRMSSPQQF